MSIDFHPYTEAQIEGILALVDFNKKRVADRVIFAAREYLSGLGHPGKKPNPPREIKRLELALLELANALSGLSRPSKEYLNSKRRAPGDDNPSYEDATDDAVLNNVVHRFLIENKNGLKGSSPPASGPIVKHHRRWFEKRLRFAFDVGFNGYPPKRGYPDFRTLCTSPDVLRLKDMDPKKWEAVRRKKPPKKLPIKKAK